MRRRRRVLARENPDAARRAAEFLPLARLAPFGVVGGYAPMGSELDPGPVLARLAAEGARIALPARADRHAPLVFCAADGGGIVSPVLIIAPLLAFDRQGGRLGQGAGWYDRAIEALRAAGPVTVIGLAFADQEVDQVPMDAHDQRLDAILTETGYIDL